MMLHYIQVVLHQGPLSCQEVDAIVVNSHVTNPTILTLTLKIADKFKVKSI